MNRIALVVFASALCLPASANEGLPRLAVAGRNLDIVEALVSVELEGRIAEIIYEIAYQNDTTRRQEGEFSLRLPAGATVSTYAIDVLGAMRPAVSVEKEQARNAYESIKRRKVDPGLVERGANNVYRNRVFPIEPKSTKRVRIGYLRELGIDETLDLPLACEGRIGRFELTVTRSPSMPEIREPSPLREPERVDADTWRWSASNIIMQGRLALPPPPAARRLETLRVEGSNNGVRHFVAQGELAPDANTRSESWRRVRVIWDTSYSGRFRDYGADLNALDQIWEWLGEAEVTAHLLSLELSPPFQFSVADGNGKALRDHFSRVRYDGSADYSKIDPFDGVTFIVGDGIVSSPIWAPKARSSGIVFLLNSSFDFASPELLAFVDGVLDRRPGNFLEILEDHRDSMVVEGLAPGSWQIVRNRTHYRITGVLPPGSPATLHLRGGGLEEREISTAPTRGTAEWNFTRRLWAQDRLADLERKRDSRKIEEHAIAERLASDLTSLIVLERMQDHVRYRIPPPEPHLLTEYQRLLSRENLHFNHAADAAWRKKLRWYETDFPWIDTELREEAAAVAIFTRAARTVFDENQVRGTNLPALEAWLPGTKAALTAVTKIDSDAAFGTWKTGARQQMEALHAIRESSEADPVSPFWFSVRGFVKERGVFQAEAPFFINAAIAKAGGPVFTGSLSRVYLYRDGQRTGYDLESYKALPVPLRPGDMIVVESRSGRYGYTAGFADPFSDGFSPETSSVGGGGAPVFETTGSVKPKTKAARQSESFGERQSVATTGSVIEESSGMPVASGADREFLNALKTHSDPAAFYRESLSGDFGKNAVSMGTVIEAARLLYERNDRDLAYGVLTNLCELEPNPVEATRSLAIWLCEFGEMDRAKQILRSLLSSAEDAATRALVQHDLARLTGESARFAEAVTTELKLEANSNSPVLLPILLTDLFEIEPDTRAPLNLIKAKVMPSDLRIVVTTAGGEASLSVATPHRLALDRDEVIFEDPDPAWHHRHPRVYEYQIRRCLPGDHIPSLTPGNSHETAMTARVDLYLRRGGKDAKRRSFTFLLERDPISLPAVDFEW